MNLSVSQVLSPQDTSLIKRYLEKQCPRMATLILFLACRKTYPNIDPDRLYKICLFKIQAKLRPPSPV
jgi:hypothetical protein